MKKLDTLEADENLIELRHEVNDLRRGGNHH